MRSLIASSRDGKPVVKPLEAALAVFLLAFLFAGCQLPILNPEIPVTGVSLNSESLDLGVGEHAQLIASIAPAKATNKAVSWTSSNGHVAVSSGGLVTAVSEGSAVVTVTTLDGSFTDTCDVAVTAPVAVTGVSLDRESATLPYGASLQLAATVLPAEASNKAVTWSSSGAAAGVSSSGLVTASALGQAVITVTTQDGSFTDTCAITVIPAVSLDLSSVSLNAGQTRSLVATVLPASAPNTSVSWSTSDESVAAVYEGKIIAVSAGSATITATAADGGHTASCVVSVSGSLAHSYAQVFPAATALQNGLNAAIASNDPGATAYCVYVETPEPLLTCHLNGYQSVGYTMNGTVLADVDDEGYVGAMNGAVAFSGGIVTEISYNEADFSASTGTLGIEFADSVTGTYDLATGVFTED